LKAFARLAKRGNLERIRPNQRVTGQKISQFDKAVRDDDASTTGESIRVTRTCLLI
jgi:hypothetical protein